MYIKTKNIQTNKVYKYVSRSDIHFFIFDFVLKEKEDKSNYKTIYKHYLIYDNEFADCGIKKESYKFDTEWSMDLATKEDIKMLNAYIEYGIFL